MVTWLASLALLIFLNSAEAARLTWTLQDVVFTDGAIASGTFDYDRDDGPDGKFSNINIGVSGGSVISDATFADLVPGVLTGPGFVAFISDIPVTPGETTRFTIRFDGFLSNAGGSIPLVASPSIDASSQEVCSTFNDPDECFLIEPNVRFVSGGFVTTSPVPVPAAAWLFGSALGILGWLRRKRA